MDKNKVREFSVWAREYLINNIEQKAFEYGVTKECFEENIDFVNGRLLTDLEIIQRKSLIKQVKNKGFVQVIDEVAYTWFNRFVALRYMEINGYLPSHIRVFTNENGEFKPEILKEALNVDIKGLNKSIVLEKIEKQDNEELYQYLLVAQCKELDSILPGLFERMDDYVELLFPNNIFKNDGIIGKMISDIPEGDWLDAVQIIGWMYQYYISEPKDLLINAKKQYKTEDIPFVTQLFTPDWIVKYMVQNSLGRYWIEATGDDYRSFDWEYYLESNNEEENKFFINPEQIKVIDPCMGSGHILVYAFDVLMQIYLKNGYTERDAAELIISKNLYGIDISKRAYQLAYFSLLMKARHYNRNILKKDFRLNLYLANNENILSEEDIKFFAQGDSKAYIELKDFLRLLNDFNETGSLVNAKDIDFDLLSTRIERIKSQEFYDIISQLSQKNLVDNLLPLIKIGKVLSEKYDIVVTNPPYIGKRYLPEALKNMIEVHYADYKHDVFAAFIVRCIEFCKINGHIGLLSPYVWMFISSYEELRKKIIKETTITSLVQLEYNAFEVACVPVCTFTLKKGSCNGVGEYVRLTNFHGADNQAPKVVEAVQNRDVDYRYTTNQNEYEMIPGQPIAYWIGKGMFLAFQRGEIINSFGEPKQGMATTDNNKYLRQWMEVHFNSIYFNAKTTTEAMESRAKWFPYNKGGEYRKWYGNNEFIVNYQDDGKEIKESVLKKYPYLTTPDFVVKNSNSYFKKSITWSYISSTNFGVRASLGGFIFDVSGSSLFVDESIYKYVLGFLCTNLSTEFINMINPTMNIQAGSVGTIPVIFSKINKDNVDNIVEKNINISKADWDSYETSWDFKKHPLI